MKEIICVRGQKVQVSDEDFELVNKYRWSVHNKRHTSYAISTEKIGDKPMYMHRLILNTPNHLVTDHIDHDGLNNTRENIRICTQAENMRNRLKRVIEDSELPMSRLLSTKDICEVLCIVRSTFQLYIAELKPFGMFQLKGKRSQYRMTADDLNAYIQSKKS
jgi:hypothetical protein